jgi:hypothetical protein
VPHTVGTSEIALATNCITIHAYTKTELGYWGFLTIVRQTVLLDFVHRLNTTKLRLGSKLCFLLPSSGTNNRKVYLLDPVSVSLNRGQGGPTDTCLSSFFTWWRKWSQLPKRCNFITAVKSPTEQFDTTELSFQTNVIRLHACTHNTILLINLLMLISTTVSHVTQTDKYSLHKMPISFPERGHKLTAKRYVRTVARWVLNI